MGMNRDNEMLKDLLIQFRDELIPGQGEVNPNSIKENYHIYLLLDAGFIAANKVQDMGQDMPFYDNLRITTKGHDFLDIAENTTVWDKTKGVLKEKGLEITTIPLDVLLVSLKAQMKNLLGLE